MTPRRIGILGFDGVTALDIVGPAEAFAAATSDSRGERRSCYEVLTLAVDKHRFVAESGINFTASYGIAKVPELDTLIVPGGSGLRNASTTRRVSEFVNAMAPKTRRVASVCTGIYGIAPTGLLDGRRVTTHWRFADDVQRRFPKLRMDRNAIFIRDGSFYTSAGITAGIDLALAMIEDDYGNKVALSVARELVVYFKRPGGQEQYSEPLEYQINSSDKVADLAPWILSHLNEDLSVDHLAARVNFCPRHFNRRFRQSFSVAPAEFVQRVRLDEARKRLSTRGKSIEEVAFSVGFASPDVFRRAFERRFGTSPRAYRQTFQH